MNQPSRLATLYLLGFALDLVNIFIASVAYPDIGRSLGASVATLAWIGNTYLLGLTLVIPLSVWLASRLGERRLMLLALAGFASASLGCGLAGSAATLIVWRLCQGLAGGLLIPLGQAMAYRNVPASARAGLTARVMLVALIVPAVAPALGGWLVDSLSWRGIFFASVAPALLVLALAGTLLFSAFRDKIEHWEYPQRFTEYVEYYAGKYGIDPMILYAFIRTESNFDPNADSDAGARGLMQITEVTFDWIKMKIAPKESLTFDDLYDPETNIRFGSYFVSYCLDRYSGHLATAAAAYHSGVGTVDGLLGQEAYSTDGVTLDHYPYPQMRLYVKKITESYQHYSEIYK